MEVAQMEDATHFCQGWGQMKMRQIPKKLQWQSRYNLMIIWMVLWGNEKRKGGIEGEVKDSASIAGFHQQSGTAIRDYEALNLRGRELRCGLAETEMVAYWNCRKHL